MSLSSRPSRVKFASTGEITPPTQWTIRVCRRCWVWCRLCGRRARPSPAARHAVDHSGPLFVDLHTRHQRPNDLPLYRKVVLLKARFDLRCNPLSRPATSVSSTFFDKAVCASWLCLCACTRLARSRSLRWLISSSGTVTQARVHVSPAKVELQDAAVGRGSWPQRWGNAWARATNGLAVQSDGAPFADQNEGRPVVRMRVAISRFTRSLA